MLRIATAVTLIACASSAFAGPGENFIEVFGLQNLNQNDIYRVMADGTTTTIPTQDFTFGIALDPVARELKYIRLGVPITRMEIYSVPIDSPGFEEFVSFIDSGGGPLNFGLALDEATRRYYYSDNSFLFSLDEDTFIPGPDTVTTYGFTAARFEADGGLDRFVTSGFSVIATGNLDGTGIITRAPVGPIITASGIDRLSGDVVWAEGTTIYRTGPDLQNPHAVLTAPEGIEITSLDAFGELIAYSVTLTTVAPQESRFRLWDGQADTAVSANLPDVFFDLKMRAEIAPPPDAITQQPISVAVDEGQPASISVQSGDPGALFQWRKNGVDLTNDARISGTTASTLFIMPTEAGDSDVYTCVVTTFVPETVESDQAFLAVRADACPESCPADVNNDGMATPADFTAWLAAFNIGCP